MERPLRRSTISDKLNARSLPEWDFVVSFVKACRIHAEEAGQILPDHVVDLARWDVAHWRMLRAFDHANADERLVTAATAEISRRASRAGQEPPDRGIQTGLAQTQSQCTVPQQLPAAVRHFAGREAELRSMSARFDEATTRSDRGLVILVVEGSAGIGKTALAVYWAHRVADRFPDGQLYVNLQGFNPTGPATPPAKAIYGFLEAFAVPIEQIPTGLDAQAALYRSLLADKHVLVVLDNAADAEHVRPLLPGGPRCLVVVTSRRQLTSLVAAEGAYWLTLNPLSRTESRELLHRQLGEYRLAVEPQAVNDIITHCARLPLALSIVAARAATHPGYPLATLAGELRDAGSRLDALDDGGTDVRSVFSWSYQQLGSEAARLFRLLGLHPGMDIATSAAASLAGQHPDEVRTLLTELSRAHLVTPHTPNRYTVPDLLRTYAAELARTHDSDIERRSATRRLLDHYLHTSHAASLLLSPHQRDSITPSAHQPGVVLACLTDHEQALAWFTSEHQALLAAARKAVASGFDVHTHQLAWNLSVFLTRQGQWAELVDTHSMALDAARRLSDRPAQAYAHYSLGMAAVELGQSDMADTHLRCALELFGALDDDTGQARTHLGFSRCLERQGRHREALGHAARAYDMYRAASDPAGQANALNSVGWCRILLGQSQQALAPCEQALALAQKTGNCWVEAAAWNSLGYTHHHLGDNLHAAACYQRALDLCRKLGDRPNEADTLLHLGDAEHAAGNRDAARTAWQQSLSIQADLNHPDAERIMTKLQRLDDELSANHRSVNRSQAGHCAGRRDRAHSGAIRSVEADHP